MKKLLYQNKEAIQKTLSHLNTLKENTSALVLEFHRLNLFELRTTEDVSLLISGGEAFIKSRIADDLPKQSFGKYSLRKEEAVNLIDLPDFNPILEAIRACNDFLGMKKLFVLKGSILHFDEEALQSYLDAFRVFALTPGEERLGVAYEKVVEALQELQSARIAVGLASLIPDNPIRKYFNIIGVSVTAKEDFYRVEIRTTQIEREEKERLIKSQGTL